MGLLGEVQDGRGFRRREAGDGEGQLRVLDVAAKIPQAIEDLRSARGAAIGGGGEHALQHLAGRDGPACKVKLGNMVEDLARSQGQH